jgi:AcrR family transcriptional regulator
MVSVSALTRVTMPSTAKPDIRTRLIQAAVDLSYEHGFGNTALVDIAKKAKVPAGNVYYYFKTKEEIAEAIIERRLSELLEAQWQLGQLKNPRERLCGLISAWLKQQDQLAKFGCPIGTFCTELSKDGGKPAQKASRIFDGLLIWLTAQFREFCSKSEAHANAVHLLSALEGVTVLIHCTKNPNLVKLESERLSRWIRSL